MTHAKLNQGRTKRTKPCPGILLQTIVGPMKRRRESLEVVNPGVYPYELIPAISM